MNVDLKSAVLALLHPLIRYLIGRGWTYPDLCETLKAVYVAEATRLDDSGQPISDSRVSLLTGIHRKDVRRLRAEQLATTNPPALRREASIAVRVVTAWATDANYQNSRNKPRPLPLRAAGKQPSFESLVMKLKADMRPAVVLDELVRAGVVQVEKDKVRLLRNAYVSALPADKLAFLGANVGDHLQSALHNIVGEDQAFLERAVYYGLVDGGDLQQARPELVRRAERFLRDINSLVMPLNTAATKRSVTNGRRMRLGVYYYEDEALPPVSTKTKERKKP